MKTNRKNKGFTLIELLTTIGNGEQRWLKPKELGDR